MDDNRQTEIAFMRHAAINSLLAPQADGGSSKEARYRDAAKKVYFVETTPGNGWRRERKYSASTIKKWYISYTKGGVDALYPKATRSDKGGCRKLSDEQKAAICAYRRASPQTPVTVLYKDMVNHGEIDGNKVSYSTVRRYVKKCKEV